MTHSFDLKQLVSPIPVIDFIQERLSKKPFFISRQNSNYYDDLLPLSEFRRYFERHDLLYPTVRLVKDGKNIPAKDFSNSFRFGPDHSGSYVDQKRLFDYFNDGYTITLSSLELSLDPIRRFAVSLYNELKGKVGVTAFYTPKGTQSLGPHYDYMDVFVVQLYGSKTWKIYDSPVYLPTEFHYHDVSSEPVLLEKELLPGDLLYFPRGFVHETNTTTQDSLSLSIGFEPFLYRDLLSLVLENCTAFDEFSSFRDRCNIEDEFGAKDMLLTAFYDFVNSLPAGYFQKAFDDKFKARFLSSYNDFHSNLFH